MNENITDAIDWLNEIITNPNGWRMFYSDSETKSCAEAVLAMLKEREAKNGYWINPTSQDCYCCPKCGNKNEYDRR